MTTMIDEEALVAFTQDLIRIPSLSGEEMNVVERIAAEMWHLHFDEVRIDRNGTVVGIVNGLQPGPTLLLDAHCDTVGIAPGSVWTHDPFGAARVDGYLYGRGAADMKGALAAMVHAAGTVDRSQLAGRVAVRATGQEEVLEGVSMEPQLAANAPKFV